MANENSRQIPKSEAAPTQSFIEIEEIKDSTVILKGGGVRKLIAVNGVNFELKSESDRALLVGSFQNFLNALDFPVQIFVHTRKVNIDEYLASLIAMETQETNQLFKTEITEYSQFVRDLVAENPIMNKSFFIVVPYDPVKVSAGGFLGKIPGLSKSKEQKEAQQKSEAEIMAHTMLQLNKRVDEVLDNLTSMGLQGVLLNTDEIIELYYNLYNPSLSERKFALKGEITEFKDLVAPGSIEINPNHIRIGDYLAKTLFVFTFPRYLADGWISPLVNLSNLIDISFFIHPVDTALALKNLRRKIANVEAEILEKEEKGQVRDPMLETAFKDIENLRDQLLQGTQRLFKVGIYMTIYASSLEELNQLEAKVINILESKLIYTKPAFFQQMDAFSSVLPLVHDRLLIHNQLNTAPLSSMFPFVSLTLTSDKGIMYGVNRHNNSLVIFDRFSLENYNLVIFAKAGSGKSYTAKLEALRLMALGADVIIIDPENEYETLANTVGGSLFKISLASEYHINPFDIPPVPEGENQSDILKSHVATLTGLLRVMLGTLSSEEVNILDRAVSETYASHDIMPGRDFSKAQPPVLEDLETILRSTEGGRGLAERLYRFTQGSYSGFANKPTNVAVKNRLIVFSIRDLEEELRPVAMYVILNFLWNVVRSELKKRVVIVDEAWIMMQHEDAAIFLFGLVKRARKYYLGITTITQDIEDFLKSPYGRPIITNSSLQILLKQSPALVDLLVKTFNLTAVEKNVLLDSRTGEGLFIAGSNRVAIQILASYYEDRIITTKPEQLLELKKEAAAEGE